MPGEAVVLGLSEPPSLAPLSERARAARPVVDPTLEKALGLARELGAELPSPGRGTTLLLWESLATLGAVDLTVARAVEPHLDALAILDEARRDGESVATGLPDDAVWGVFAAEGQGRLLASPSPSGTWSLTGPKSWCSLADRVSHALVTAWLDDDERGLFVVDLGHDGVRPQTAQRAWVARGLAQVGSTGLELTDVPAVQVGGPGWYLRRPGFAWGGIGVAAVWFGATVAVARRVRQAALAREPDQIALAHLGATDVALARARAVLLDTARAVDGPRVDAAVSARLALRVRHVVADTAEEVLLRAGHALGPAPLALEEEHARRVSDLGLYMRQHHGERDAAALGSMLLGEPVEGEWSWW